MVKYEDYSWSREELAKEKAAKERHDKKVKKALMKAEKRKRNLEIKCINSSYRGDEKEKKKVSTTKLLMAFIFINCTVVEAYSMWVMYTLGDLSALYALIGAVITESISFAIYCVKAFNETKEEERLCFEREKFETEHSVANEELISEDMLVQDETTDISDDGLEIMEI